MTPDQSAVLIPALEAEQLVGPYRMRHDPNARLGVPAHITVMFPFLPPDRITAEVLADLDALFASVSPFVYALTRVDTFPQGVLFLAPDPEAPFIAMTAMVGERFGLLPFGGAYDKVVPHLTVTQTAPAPELSRIGDALQTGLPRSLHASEAWVMVGAEGTQWRPVHVARMG